MPSTSASATPTPSCDEYALLDSIFSELDDNALDELERTNKVLGKRKSSSFHACSKGKLQTKDWNRNSNQERRRPLQILSNSNGRSSNNTKQEVVVNNKNSSTPTGPPSAVKPNPSISHIQPTKKKKKQDNRQDEALLDGIEWSGSDDELDTITIAKQEKPAHNKLKLESTALLDPIVKARSQPDYIPISQRFTRCIVNSVFEKKFRNYRREKTVIVEVEATAESRRVILYDEWATTELEEGDTINVIGTFSILEDTNDTTDSDSSLPTCVLSYQSENLLILHPDTLVSATRVSDTPVCSRKAIVQEKLRTCNDLNPSLVYGNLLHELFQSCLLAMAETLGQQQGENVDVGKEAFSVQKREKEIDRLLKVPKNVEYLFMIGIELEEARVYLKEKSLGFGEFAERFVGQNPQPDAYLADPRSCDSDPNTSTRFSLTGVHDIEEDIWSPRLGLKGKVDASIASCLIGPKTFPTGTGPLGEESRAILPFEIKTGRNSGIMQHRAQTMLYTQMMSHRYDRPIESGLLYYTQHNSVIRVQAAKNEVRGLIISRNEMASYLKPLKSAWQSNQDKEQDEQDRKQKRSLPPSQLSPFRSNRAQVKNEEEAMELDLAIVKEEKTDELDDESALWADINMDDLKAFPDDVDEVHVEKMKPLLPSAIDEERNCKKCYAADGCMLYRRAIEKTEYIAEQGTPLQEMYQERTGHLTENQTAFFQHWERLISLEESELSKHKKEMWTMTAAERQKHGRCLANMTIDPAYRKSERDPTSKGLIHRYTYRMVRSSKAIVSATPTQHSTSSIDKHSLLHSQINVGDPVVVSIEPSVLGLARGFVLEIDSNYITLGLNHSLTILPGERDMEDLQVGGCKVTNTSSTVYRIDKDELQAGLGRIRDNLARLFYSNNGDEKRLRLVVDLEPPRFEEDKALASTSKRANRLNRDQLEAVNKVLTARDYALILGLPGTGKTTTIAEIIKALLARGKTILLTSYTHSAVDNILLKLTDLEPSKILRLGNIDKIMPSLAHLSLASQNVPNSIAELEQRYFTPQIVAATALSIDHPLFSRRKFDYCIIDEASQITLPTCLGPIRFAERFVLVGDHFQLPPLVKNYQARQDGLEISLFGRLSEAHPEAMVYLTQQYRMNKDIMSLSNRLIYNDRLICGNDQVAERGLVLPKKDAWERMEEKNWLKGVLCESRNVIFINTDALPAPEMRSGNGIQNEVEARLVLQTTEALLSCGVLPSSIGIIALYRQQIRLLDQLFKTKPDIEVLTADKSQGRDKDCIIMSLVRSNAEQKVGELLLDWRRLNVCFTRAKSKLIIFGSRNTLENVPLLKQFFEIVDEKGWMLDLPKETVIPATPRPHSATKGSSKQSLASSSSSRAPLSNRRIKRDQIDDIEEQSLKRIKPESSSPVKSLKKLQPAAPIVRKFGKSKIRETST